MLAGERWVGKSLAGPNYAGPPMSKESEIHPKCNEDPWKGSSKKGLQLDFHF